MVTDQQQLQDHLNRLRTGQPILVLSTGQATAQAVRLRNRGMSWTSVAHAMAAYHGQYLSAGGWKNRCHRSPTSLRGRGKRS